jgi:hypothetical protein
LCELAIGARATLFTAELTGGTAARGAIGLIVLQNCFPYSTNTRPGGSVSQIFPQCPNRNMPFG